MKAAAFKTLVFVHRYVGIAIGWLMLMWCLTGVVMMYVRYPELRESQRLTRLQSLTTWQCCDQLTGGGWGPTALVTDLQLEMLAGAPVLRLTMDGQMRRVDLATGIVVDAWPASTVLAVAERHAQGPPFAQILGLIERDQWTVYPRYGDYLPLFHVRLNDSAGTEVYVSSRTGTVVQQTDRRQRFWNWVGTVPHWLYFTEIRARATLWNNLVIVTSLLGCFLTLFGLALGVWQLRRRHGSWTSPYRGWKFWHHLPGLIGGGLLLSWVFSGLMSMQPWGFLESDSDAATRAQLQGEAPSWSTLQSALAVLSGHDLRSAVQVRLAINASTPYWVITDSRGQQQRWNMAGTPAPLTEAQLPSAVGAVPVISRDWLTEGDTYYYSHGDDQVTLPVWRILLGDAQSTRLYLDANSGELIKQVDAPARAYRWLHLALHRMDFSALWRSRPWWDGWMLVWLAGAMLICVTGVWLGIRHLRR